jgi:hypothetical protein
MSQADKSAYKELMKKFRQKKFLRQNFRVSNQNKTFADMDSRRLQMFSGKRGK